ncbi:MAG: DNA-processing protein DprA [Pirellulales bacterium]
MNGDAPRTATDARELTESLRLAMTPGVGPATFRALVERFGSPAAVFDAPTADVRSVPGVGPKTARSLATAREEIDPEAELALCRTSGIQVVPRGSSEYPRLLETIYDPPSVLFMRGSILPTDALAVAVVGSRHATRYGLQQAERLAAGLSRAGLTIVSGLARGIDAAAHRGALAAGGRTLAVLGSGLLEIYPPEHAELADEVAAHGALVSELPPKTPPVGAVFPQRNRIITGLSLGVVVVEASDRSGALISARHAMDQGREVFAVPGRIDSRMSRGCHALIRDGAKLVESVDDILEELGPLPESGRTDGRDEIRHAAELQLNDVERAVLAAVELDPTPIDSIVARAGVAIHQVLATVSILEMRRLVRRVSGQLIVRI